MKTPIVIAEGLHKNYEQNHAVQGISFQIARGEIFSLLGPNGAGKTTTISMLSGLIEPSAGDAAIAGYSVRKDPQQVKAHIGVVPQELALYETISAHENLVFWGRMYGLGGNQLRERVQGALEIAGLSDRARERVEKYSGGMKRRLNIAIGLLHEPEVLFLDEPTVGIDPQSRRRILDTIKLLNQQGLTVLYTTHYMEEAEEISDRIGIIDHGKLIAVGTFGQLTQLTGGYDTLMLQVNQNGFSMEQIVGMVAELPTIGTAQNENGSLVLHSEDGNQALSDVVNRLSREGVSINKLEIQEPNLEAVFLHLTGRALRD